MPVRRNIRIKQRNIDQDKWNEMLDHFRRCGYELYDYQKTGARFMLNREIQPDYRPASLLCDEPGLGKTIQTGALMYMNFKTTLLVLPKCVISQWNDFLKCIFPDVGIYIHHGTKRCSTRADFGMEMERSKFVLTTYGMFKELSHYRWGRIVYDEIHYLRNPESKRSRDARKMLAGCYLGLTGTPVNNKLNDLRTLYGILHFPEVLLDRSMSSYFDELNKRYILRRIKSDVEDVNERLRLPNLDISVVETPLLFRDEMSCHAEIMRQIYTRFAKNGILNRKLITLEWYMRMRQACLHPLLVDAGLCKKWGIDIEEFQEDADYSGSTKFEAIRHMMNNHEDEKTLIFCHYTQEITMLRRILEDDDWTVFQIDGSKSVDERADEVHDFRYITTKSVMIIQIKAGSVGMNLQFASRVYITSPHWNPSVEIQAIARAHRIGQERPVKVIKFVTVEDFGTRKFIEDLILVKQGIKRDIMARVLEDDKLLENGERITLDVEIIDKIKSGIRA